MGDILPFINMGVILKKNGYNIHFLTNPYYKSPVENAGLLFYPIGALEDCMYIIDPENTCQRQKNNLTFINPIKQIINAVDSISGKKIILSHFGSYGAKIAAEKFNVPIIVVSLSGFWFNRVSSQREKANPNYPKVTNDIRIEEGLEPLEVSELEWMLTGNVVSTVPESFVFKGVDTTCVGFIDADIKAEAPKELIDFCKKYNPIVFTPGTWKPDQETFFYEAKETLKRLGMYGVFLTQYPLQEEPEEYIYAAKYVPLESILEHCSALVHHGGIGTTYQGLKAQIPQVICYWMEEQKYNADMIRDKGLCEFMSYADIDSDKLTAALTKMLPMDCKNDYWKTDESKLINYVKECSENGF
jgi:rhamnosyltransferase subunit B